MKYLFISCMIILSCQFGNTSDNIYYKVSNIESNDVLNIREKNHHKSKLINTLKPEDDCIEILLDSPKWVIIKKDNKIGWVNKKFLKISDNECKAKKTISNLTMNIYSNYDHHNRVVGLTLDEKKNIIASIDQDKILVIRTLDTKKIVLKKMLNKTGRLKFSPTGNYLNIIDEANNTISIYSFPNLNEKATFKISEQLISKVWGLKAGFFQKYRIGNIEVVEGEEETDIVMHGTKQLKHHGRKIYRNKKLIYHEGSCGIMDFTMVSKYSKKRNSIFFANGLSTNPSIYEVSAIDGKWIWDTSYASNGKTNTGGSGAILFYNKKDKLLYALEDIEYIEGEIVVWDMSNFRIKETSTLKHFKNLPYVYKFAHCVHQSQITQSYDTRCHKVVNLPSNIYQHTETNNWIIGQPIKLDKNTINYDDATVTILDENNKIIARMIKDEMKKYNNYDGMTFLQDGYFTGGKSVPVSTSIGLKSISINQLYDHFFRPDLVQLKLSGDEEAYQKAINGMTYQEALKNPPPKVSIIKVDDKSISKSDYDYSDINTTKLKTRLSFNVKEYDGGGIGLIRVYQEGKLIQIIGEGKDNRKVADVFNANKENKINTQVKQTQEKMRLASNDKENKRGKGSYIPESELLSPKSIDTITNNQEGKKTIEAILQSGDNQFCVEAFNKTNTVTSYRECINIHANIPKRKPKLYGLAIGINDFSTHREYGNLTYSQKDAQDIKDAIEKQNHKLYESIEIETLLGVKATQENILAKLKTIKDKASIDDTIVFYISTHGTANNNELYLIPQNAKDDYISFNNIFQAIQSIPSLKQIMIVDACQSGQASDIVSSIYDSRASVLAKSAGVHLLLATTKGTSAFESQEENIKNGVFTYQILTALKDKETDTNKDNVISVIELSNRLKSQAHNTEAQYPIIRNVGGDVKLREAM